MQPGGAGSPRAGDASIHSGNLMRCNLSITCCVSHSHSFHPQSYRADEPLPLQSLAYYCGICTFPSLHDLPGQVWGAPKGTNDGEFGVVEMWTP